MIKFVILQKAKDMSEILKNPYKNFISFNSHHFGESLQAYFTEITLDEAYYYQYARDLDWDIMIIHRW